MEKPKVTLSDAELELVTDANFILTKNRIIDKVYQMFGGLSEQYALLFEDLIEYYPAVFSAGPKISKGEKYEQLPWVMLDYPRCFSQKEGHFAIRTFFWWGHFFSIRLQLSGSYRHAFQAKALNKLPRNDHWQIMVASDPWKHNYDGLYWNQDSKWQDVRQNEDDAYLLITAKIPLSQWSEAGNFLLQHCIQIIRTLE